MTGAPSIPHAVPVPWDPLNAWPAGRRWLWAALTVLVVIQAGPRFLRSLRPQPGEGTDFTQEWLSARNLLCGEPVYARLEGSVARHMGLHVPPGSLTIGFNAHPPTSVLLAVPFAALDYYDAALAWNLLSLVAFAASLWLVLRQLRIPFAGWSVLPLVTLLLICAPLWYQVALGQLNLILLLLVTGAWAAERAGRPSWAGVLVGTAAAVKLFPGFLLLYLAARRQWRGLAAGICTLVVLTGLSVAVLGVESYRSYVRDVLPTLGKFQCGWNNHSLAGIWAKLFAPAVEEPLAAGAEPAGALTDAAPFDCVDATPVYHTRPLWHSPATAAAGTAVCRALVVVTLLVLVWRSRSRGQIDLAFGLALTAMLLVSPITWEHYFLLLLVPWFLVWVRLPSSALVRGLFMALTAAFWLDPSVLWEPWLPCTVQNYRHVWGVATPVHTLTVLSLHCYALLGLFAFLLVQWPREMPLTLSSFRTAAETSRNTEGGDE
jgi:hypothetical protein